MNSTAKAFAPGNISCVFKICYNKNPRWMGSCGIGFTVNEGAVAEVSKSEKNEIFFSGKKINFPTVRTAIEKLTKEEIRVIIKSKLPLGCGFGLSGASALATAYALNKLLNLNKTTKELALIAHIAEVENKTGLGDVVNQFFGGFCIKFEPSSHFIIEKLQFNNTNVYCRYFSQISTKSVITNPKLKNKINKAASKSLNEVKKLIKTHKNIILGDIIKISKVFSLESGLLKQKNTTKIIENIEKNNGNAGMIMLGNSVFSDIPFTKSIKLKISDKAAYVF